ncbi:NmrA family NAD(P)-binding protein [Pedobacter sp. 22226]|uniref:NmrA family NAD(P)-binding protein n=1 Tax=Pedobacter sp. 22226 TaxID=3453894 RepID=UPI003F86DB5D
MNNKPLILIAGATGTQGGAVIEALLAKHIAVRAIVRDKNSEAAKALAAKNLEIAEATFDDLKSLTQAAKGATGVFSVQMGTHPGNKGQETLHANNLIAAAKAAGIEQIVHTSVARAGEHENFAGWEEGRWEPLYWEEKAAAIDAVKTAGFTYWTVIKPPFIMVNVLPPMDEVMFPTLREGKIVTPIAPDTKIDWVSPNDIGRFAAEAFAQPEKFNKKEFAITGDNLTMTQVADVLSSIVGKRFEAISQTEEEAANSGLFKYGIDSYLWQNVEGYKVDPQEIAAFGIQPESLKTFLEHHKTQLQKIYSELK